MGAEGGERDWLGSTGWTRLARLAPLAPWEKLGECGKRKVGGELSHTGTRTRIRYTVTVTVTEEIADCLRKTTNHLQTGIIFNRNRTSNPITPSLSVSSLSCDLS